MKVLELHGMHEDGLRLDFEGALLAGVALERELGPLIQALEEFAGGWMPDVVNGKRRRKYSRASFWKTLEERREGSNTDLELYRTEPPALSMALGLRLPPAPPVLNIRLKLKPLSFFSETERCRQFVEMMRAWASCYPVSHASAHSMADGGLAGFPRFGRGMQTSIRDGFDKIYEIFWLNVFGVGLVESVGRERMLSTPAYRVEELPNGSVLLVTWPTASSFASDEARVAQARALVHLRPDLDPDTVLRTLRERSVALAPVEPRFHPDVASLLSRMVDSVAIHERQRKIAELNAYRPPEPEEWCPAGSALAPDVEDPERARAHYSELSERLVALLHMKVPSVFEASPQSLTDVDYQFWHEEFPRVFERQHIDAQAVPAIGAYLGEVLVRHLGGRWVPRQKLEESQVLVGERVWMPFARAHRYMRSCQSLLDYSLTQFYRVAERYRG